MYLSHYGLERPPFDPAPQADDLFETPTHNEALAALVYGILENKGFIVLLGEVGVGKTTVLRRALHYVATAEPKLLTVEVANPTLGPAALAGCIHRALQFHFEAGSVADLDLLRSELVRLGADGWRLLLVIDEAQSLPPATLEFVRIMSNLASDGRALIQVVLCGQPELDATLRDPSQRALRQRVAVRAHIQPLSRRQVADYVRFKLGRAGAPAGAVLTRAAVRAIAASSHGFPRRINVIGDNVLIAGYGADRKPIGRRIVAEVIRVLDDRPRRRFWGLSARLALPAAAALTLVILGWTAMPSPFGRAAGSAGGPIAPVVQSASAPAPAETAPADMAPADTAPVEIAPADLAPAPLAATELPAPAPTPAVLAAPAGSAPSLPEVVAVAEPAAAAPAPPSPAAAPVAYRVKPGESLTGILRDHAMIADAATLAQVRQINPALADLDLVRVGQDILLPPATPAVLQPTPR